MIRHLQALNETQKASFVNDRACHLPSVNHYLYHKAILLMISLSRKTEDSLNVMDVSTSLRLHYAGPYLP